MADLIVSPDDSPSDEVAAILDQCDGLTLFQLFRLNIAIDRKLSDPQRIAQVRNAIHVGDEIEYFDQSKNRCVRAIVKKCSRTRLSVFDLEDNKHWSIEYAAVNLGDEQDFMDASKGISRENAAVGEFVIFHDKHGEQHVGSITKLNQKTAGILCTDGTKWRVGYGLLTQVIDGNAAVSHAKAIEHQKDSDTPLFDD
ncbi:MAG: hypothetical protein KDB27_11625 [Planctomycetales bacterium]|nr:hypothetical protein [Planctomycetales bacterium]